MLPFGLPLVFVIAAIVAGVGLLLYSQTSAFTGDEGFHLLAAQLIDKGRRPYIDFAFPQTPLNTYANALCLRLFGQTWRGPHALAAVWVILGALLVAQFVWRRFPASPKWRAASALVAFLFIVTNAIVVEYGTVAQAYALCLILTVAAFRFAVVAVERPTPLAAMGAGLCAGGAAASSLLVASVAPIYLLWMVIYNRAGSRWLKAALYCAAGLIPFAPVFWLWSESHRPVIFNLFEYHLFFRKLYWPETTQHDLEIVTSWIDSGQALILLLLCVAGLLFVVFRSQWKAEIRREFYLSAWLLAAICLEISTAHPTFSRYYILAVPFAAILAAAGVYMAAERLYRPESPYFALSLLAVLLGLGLAKSLYERSSNVRTWAVHEQLAKKLDEAVPRNEPVFADEEIYFLTQRTPPEGLEFSYSHKLKLAPALAAQLHIIDQDRLNSLVAGGKFAAAATCDDEFLDAMHFDTIYAHKFETDDCYVYWGKPR